MPPSQLNTDTSYEMSSIIFKILPYTVLIVIYLYIYMNKNNAMLYIEYIILIILNFFTIVFLYKDMFSIENVNKTVFQNQESYAKGDEMNIYSTLFIIIIFTTLLLNIATIGIIISVLNTGRTTIKSSDNYEIAPKYKELLFTIKQSFFTYLPYILFFALFVAYSHTNGITKIIIQNIVGLILSIIVIGFSVYLCILSVRLLKGRKFRGMTNGKTFSSGIYKIIPKYA